MRLEFHELVWLIANSDLEELQTQLASGLDPNICDESNRPLLHWAAQEGNVASLKCLLDRGAKIDAQDSLGFTPLSVAAGEDEDGLTGKTAFLLERGASPNIRIHSCENGTVLHLAASWGWFGIIKLLVQTEGIDLNLKDDEGHTPLSFAREEGTREIIDYLIQRGARD